MKTPKFLMPPARKGNRSELEMKISKFSMVFMAGTSALNVMFSLCLAVLTKLLINDGPEAYKQLSHALLWALSCAIFIFLIRRLKNSN
jgi:hypothetical protein